MKRSIRANATSPELTGDVVLQAEKCRDKRVFWFRKEAKHAAKTIRARAGEVLRPYQCPICSRWHLTSQQRR